MKIKVNEVELYYEEYGKGDPIIFAHGWMEDHSTWYSQVVHFSKTHRVILYDQRGHGRSDKPQRDYSIQTLSNDLYSFTQKLNVKQFTLVGHSLGGMVAMTFTLAHPEKVSKLVLIGTGAKSTIALRTMLWVMLRMLPYKVFAEGSADFKHYNPSEQIKEEAIDRALRVPKYAAYECFKEFGMKFDLRNRISGIKVPTLIIVGDKDTSMPVKLSRFLNKQIRGSKLEIIPHSKHMPMIDDVEKVNKMIDDFISEP